MFSLLRSRNGILAVAAILAGFAGHGYGSGELDPTLGNGGVVQTVVNSDAPNENMTMRTIVEPGGKIISMGFSNGDVAQPPAANSWFVVRYLENGQLDPNFGNNGQVVQAETQMGVGIDGAVEPDGKLILVIGAGKLRRLDQNGNLDLAFGNNGLATPWEGSNFFFSRPVAQKDGKVLFGGCYNPGNINGSPCISAIYRLNVDGNADTTFGQGGRIVFYDSPGGIIASVAVRPDGRIVVLNSKSGGGIRQYGSLLQLMPDGTWDYYFQGGDIAHPGRTDCLDRVVVSPSGALLVSGLRVTGKAQPVVFGFLSNGTVDKGFGPNKDGVLFPQEPTGTAGFALIEDFEPKTGNALVLVASRKQGVYYEPGFYITRVSPQGIVDTSFGQNGYAYMPSGLSMTTFGMAVQPDGKAVVGGYVLNGNRVDSALARYLP